MGKLPFDYELIRSDRKTVGIQIGERGLIVRAPKKMSVADIEKTVLKNSDWINSRMKKYEARQNVLSQISPLTEDEMKTLVTAAHKLIPERVAYYAPIVGVSYGRITLRFQKSRYGSCSAKGNLNFNIILLLAPPEVLDAIVVHELCHRKEMNHSNKFYNEVLRVYPEYRKWDKWLKENGSALIKKIPV